MIFLAAGTFSCKKNYTCDCTTTWTYSGGTEVNKNSSKEYSSKLTKKQAEATCDHEAESLESTIQNINTTNGSSPAMGSVMAECELD